MEVEENRKKSNTIVRIKRRVAPFLPRELNEQKLIKRYPCSFNQTIVILVALFLSLSRELNGRTLMNCCLLFFELNDRCIKRFILIL